MVDAADHDKLEASRNELHNLLDKPQLQGIPILVLGNKRDLDGALDEKDLIERMWVVPSEIDWSPETRIALTTGQDCLLISNVLHYKRFVVILFDVWGEWVQCTGQNLMHVFWIKAPQWCAWWEKRRSNVLWARLAAHCARMLLCYYWLLRKKRALISNTGQLFSASCIKFEFIISSRYRKVLSVFFIFDPMLYLPRNLAAIQDREICCYSISCKEKENIGKNLFSL